MPFREVRDPDTGELVVKYDPQSDAIQYRNRDRRLRVAPLGPYRDAAKSEPRARQNDNRGDHC